MKRSGLCPGPVVGRCPPSADGPVLSGVVTVTIGSLRPELSIPGPEEASWLAHFVAYSRSGGDWRFRFSGARAASSGRRPELVALGVAIEFAQLYVPGRYGTVDDGIVDLCGVAVGCGLSLWLRRRWSAGD